MKERSLAMCAYHRKNTLAHLYHESKLDEMAHLSSPLLKNTPVRGFRCGKILEGGRFTLLSTYKDWARAYFENSEDVGPKFQQAIQQTLEGQYQYYLWPSEPGTNKALCLNYDFNIWNGVTIYKREPDGVRYWTLTAGRDQRDMANFFLNSKEEIEAFLEHIERKISPLLDLSKNPPVAYFQTPFDIHPPQSKDSKPTLLKTFQEISQNFLKKPSPLQFSKRELQCLYLLSKGHSIKQIGQFLDLSPRTVEYYLDKVREKTGLRNKVKLINFFNTHLSKSHEKNGGSEFSRSLSA